MVHASYDRVNRDAQTPRKPESSETNHVTSSFISRRDWLALTLPVLALGPALSLPAAAATVTTTDDPLKSVQWPSLRQQYLGNGSMVYDPRIKVVGPQFADDPMSVPISVDATALLADGDRIVRMVVVVERNPIKKVLEFSPTGVLPKIAFRFKLEQASPVRVAVLDQKGVWHVGGVWVDASGGGCTVAGATRADGSWSRTLNKVQTRYFTDVLGNANETRLRLRIMHPMDTGLVAGIPAFYIENVKLETEAGQPMFTLALFEPVSENPTFSFDFSGKPPPALRLVGADNNGNRVFAEVRS